MGSALENRQHIHPFVQLQVPINVNFQELTQMNLRRNRLILLPFLLLLITPIWYWIGCHFNLHFSWTPQFPPSSIMGFIQGCYIIIMFVLYLISVLPGCLIFKLLHDTYPLNHVTFVFYTFLSCSLYSIGILILCKIEDRVSRKYSLGAATVSIPKDKVI